MDFPDPDEEYELMHADELEVMREMEGELFHVLELHLSKKKMKVLIW